MPLRKHKSSIKFANGVQGKVDHKILPPEHLVTLENGRFSKIGAIDKRNGYSLVDKAASDVVEYKNSVVARNTIIGDRASSGTVTAGSVYSYGSGEFIGNKGFSEGIDYSAIPVSKGSVVRQEDSNTAISHDGKWACVTFVDVDWDRTNNKKVYNKRFSIVDRETNSVIESDIKLGAAEFSGNNGRRMKPVWNLGAGKFYIFGEDEGAFKVWVVDPTTNPIVVKDSAGATTKAGTEIFASANYPLTVGGSYELSTASFDVCDSYTVFKINIAATFATGGNTYVRHYQLTTPENTLSSSIWEHQIDGTFYSHIAIHRARVTGSHANKLSVAYQDDSNIHLITSAEGGSSNDEVLAGIGSDNRIRCIFRDSLNPRTTSTDDVQLYFEIGNETMGGTTGTVCKIYQIDSIHANSKSALGTFKYISQSSRLLFALGRDPISLGITHADNTEVANQSDQAIKSIELFETNTNDHPGRFSANVTNMNTSAASLPQNMFNNFTDATITNPCSSISGQTMSVTFEPPIIYSSSVKVFFGANSSGAAIEWRLNGTGGFTSLTTTSAHDLFDIVASGSGTMTQLEFKKTGGIVNVFGIQVDGTYLYDSFSPGWRRDHLPLSTFDEEFNVDIFQSDSVTDLSTEHLNGSAVAIPVGSSFDRFGTAGTLVLNSITTLFDFRRYNEERIDIPAASKGMLHDILYVADKGLFQYDGKKFHALNFVERPMVAAALVSSSSGAVGTSADGAYGKLFYKVVYEWVDAQGNLHQSEPSDSVEVTYDSTHEKVNVTITGLDYGGFHPQPWIQQPYKDGVSAAIYRTQTGGSLYNQIMSVSLDKGSDVITVEDNITDAVAATGKFLYTDSGELANRPPPTSARYVIAHRDRVFVIGKDDVVYYSKLVSDGFGAAFNEALYIKTPNNISDPPTALGSMDGNLFIFTQRSIYMVAGEGPDNLGSGGFYDIKKIPSLIGATKGSPIQLTDNGLFFVSDNGTGKRIYLLGRNLAITHEGAAIENILNPPGGTPLTVRDVVVMPEQETVLFLLNQIDGTAAGAKIISFNFGVSQWGVDNLLDTYDAGAGGSFALSSVKDVKRLYISLLHHVSNKNPRVYTENTNYKDNSVYVPMKIKTAWVNLAGIQSYQRVYAFHVLGESIDKHTLTVNVYYDYDASTVVDSYTFSTATATDAVLQFRGHLSKQKCQAIQFEIVDADNAGSTDEGYTITEIALEMGLNADGYKQANAKLNSTSTIGSNS